MDLKTSFVFYFVSMALYLIVLTAMALADKRVVGTRWLAYSVLIEMMRVALQVMGSSIPRALSTMVAAELNVVAFFSMYLGLRWFMQREPLRSRTGPMVLLIVMAIYCVMYLLHIPYGVELTAAAILWMCAELVVMMAGQREERFRLPARITMVLLLVMMGLALYRAMLAAEIYRRPDWRMPVNDLRWDNSMLLIVLLANSMLIMYVWFAAAEMYSAVEATAGMDALTGCLNRRALMKVAAQEMVRSERTSMPLMVVALDLDHFKRVNDTYGHAAGDATLCAVVTLLQNRLRSVDVVARTGGEEFLLLLPDTDAVAGAKVVEELLQAIAAMRVEHEGQMIATTVSAGVTQSLPRNDSWTAVLKRADHALYAAKHAGRNCAIVDEQVLKLPRRAVGVREKRNIDEDSAGGRTEGATLRLIRKRLG